MSYSVYRCYDADGQVLYIGHSARVLGRLAEHAETKDWWKRVTNVTVEHYASRIEASTAETAAIEAEAPEMNQRAGALIAKDRSATLEVRRAIGHRIRAARRRANIKQVELGEALNLSQSAVAHWESGRKMPDAEHRVRLGEIFGLTFDELEVPA